MDSADEVVVVDELGASLWLIRLLGEVDISNVAQLSDAMTRLSDEQARVVVDLSEVEFADSSTLHALSETSERLPGRVVIVVPEDSQANLVFEASGYIERLPVVRSREEALGRLS